MTLYNIARVSTATVGTGPITLGSAVFGYLTFALSGVSNGEVVSYGIKDGGNSEVGTGTYSTSGPTLTRSVTTSTNSNAPISLSGSAQVYITARAEDIVTPTGVQTLTNKTLTDPFISRIYGGSAAGSSLTLQATNNGSPSGDSIPFVLSGSNRGGFGGSVFSPWVFNLKPNGTDYRFAVNDASTQIGYDVILLGGSQFDSGATGTPNMTWKAPLSGFPDVPFGGILGNNITSSNHAFMMIAASPNGTDNPLEYYTNNGAGTSVRRLQINGGAAIPEALFSNLTLKLSNNTAALPSTTTSSNGQGLQIGMEDGRQSFLFIDSFAANSALIFRRANNTAASPSAVLSTENIGFFGASGYKATAYSANQAAIAMKASANWTDTSTPTDVTIETTPSASTSRAESVRFLAAGNMKFTNAANFSANGLVATILGSLGPTGSHTTVQKWLTIVDNTGATLYVPAF